MLPGSKFLLSNRLLTLPGVRHGFFTRRGGVSTGIFAELNCGGRDTAETSEIVDANRQIVAGDLGLEPTHLLSTRQVHGPCVVTVGEPWTYGTRPQADAMVTHLPGIGLGVLTADCVPVLFADARTGVIGAAHSGWKGAVAGVLEATVAAMEELGAVREHIIAAIGPCIAQQSYQVDAAFRERFVQRNIADERYFTALDASNHCNFDLPAYVLFRLSFYGIKEIDVLGNDTYGEEADFFSFRRSVHRGETDYGRQISVIALTP